MPRLSELEVPVPCPKCGQATKIPARAAAPGFEVRCAACGTTFALTDEDLKRLQKGLDDLTQTSRRFGGRQA
jgi:tRNA(Ile2) C34 agmatinyltransferase TiaS